MIHGYIIIRKKSGADGPQFPVRKSVKIGRGTHCDVRIHVQSVSEQHCLILVEKDKRAMIQNLSTTSQTLVNGVPIGKGTCALKDGDVVSVGERSFRWHYGQQTAFFECKKVSSQKRRKSEADSNFGSHNIAVVNPLFHKRRTLGPNITYSEKSARTPKKSLKAGTSVDLKRQDKTTPAKTPISPKSPKTPRVRLSVSKAESKTPLGKSPVVKTPLGKSPAPNFPSVKTSSAQRSSVVTTPLLKSPVKSPLCGESSAVTPAKSPNVVPPSGRSSAKSLEKTTTAHSSEKSSSVKTPTSKTPARMSATKSSAKRSSVSKSTPKSSGTKAKASKTPRVSLASSKRKSKSAAKPARTPKGQKRRLSSPVPVASKRLKIESPKSIDKKKMAVLMGIHGRTPRVASSTLSTVKVVLSARKTPIVKALKTPLSSTAKKGSVKSSVKKSRRPLFSEILKKKAVQTANTAAKKLALIPKPAPKPVTKKVQSSFSMEVPQKFKFGSTGHANSPEPIFIGRKVAKTPVVTKKGRKAPVVATKAGKTIVDYSGVPEMFKTPGKTSGLQSSSPDGRKSAIDSRSRLSRNSTSSLSNASASQASRKSKSLNTSGAVPQVQSPPGTPKSVKKLSQSHSSPVKKDTPVKSPGNPVETLSKSMSSSPKTPGVPQLLRISRSSNVSAVAAVEEGKLTGRTPRSASKSFNRSTVKSGAKRYQSLLTSTPAVRGKRQSFADSVFESPSSVLTGQMSTPQSPASGRKSRLDMAAPKTPHVHSPHASPKKSSLKSSPPKSPEKHLSVSFNDSIHIQMLVGGSKRSLNTTAPLRSPASSFGEGSGVATPDQTTFDFNSVKTPNVPREMFVSSILSSGASSADSPSSGSAKRKKTTKSPRNDLSDVRGVKRLMKTPSSPAGYVDVAGVKRLMTGTSKSPTYLAVEGVKKLFGDAAVAAGNELSSFPGVRELFASPSPSKAKLRLSSPKETHSRSSPVAKIQAEVESKGRSPSDSKVHCSGGSPVATTLQGSAKKVSPTNKSSPVKAAPSTPVTRGRRATRKAAQSHSSPSRNSPDVKPKRGRAAEKKVPSPKQHQDSPVVLSPPKRRTRKAAIVSPPKSPARELELPKGRAKRGATRAAAKSSPAEQKDEKSPASSPKRSPVQVRTRKATSKKAIAPKTPSPVKSPPTKRATRRGAKAATQSPNTKIATKRVRSPSEDTDESPVKRSKKDMKKSVTPVQTSTKRTTRKAKKEPSPQKENNSKKRKTVTFQNEAATPKKGKASVKEADSSPPERSKKTRDAASKRNQPQSKKASPSVQAVSPRRTRSRK